MELGNELQLLMAASPCCKGQRSCGFLLVYLLFICFSMELFLVGIGTVQALHPVALVQEEMLPVLLQLPIVPCTLLCLSTAL